MLLLMYLISAGIVLRQHQNSYPLPLDSSEGFAE